MNATLRESPAAPVEHDPFADGALARVAPTTEPQREVWLADRLGEQASLAFNESMLLRFRGALCVDALSEALQMLVDRHESLRATLGPDGETFCVAESLALAVDMRDLRALAPAARAREVVERKRLAVATPFSLERGPLFRVELLRLDDEDHLLILSAHHVVCDGWSWWLITRELAELYAVAREHATPRLPAAESFADHALAQAGQGDSRQRAEDQAYWQACYAHGAPVLDLPLDRPRPPRRSFASAREDHLLDAALVSDLKRLGARRGASLFATLLGGFSVVLGRLAGQDEVVIGIPAAGQSVNGLDNLVGHCVNLLPLRFETAAGQPFEALLDASQAALLDALEHQRLTFGTLLRTLRIERDPSRLPLVGVMFNIDQVIEQEASHFPGLALEFSTNPRICENFELFINAVQTHDGVLLECQYNRDLFDAATIRRWLRAYETLLRAAVAQPGLAIGQLPMVDADDATAQQALQSAPTSFPRNCGMHQLFERQCDSTPDAVALRFGDASLKYAELEQRSNRIAALLRACGVHSGALVGLAVDRGPDLLAGLLGILKTGAGYVPLDPAFPAERLAYMVGDAGLGALVTERAHAERFDLRGRPVFALDALGEELAALSPERVQAPVDPESVAYVIYTSGSTGKPKGVQIPHRAVSNFITAMQARPGIGAGDRLVAVTTLSFDIAVLELLLPLSVGAQVVLADRETALDGTALMALLDSSGATLMQATPATWRMLLDAGWQGGNDFRVLCGGEPMPPDLANALLERSGECWNLYGPTETTVWSTCWRVQAPEQGIRIGTPIANTTVWILDARQQPCPLGIPGELCIGGDGVALGYRGRDDLNAEHFLDDPFVDAPGARLYRTGDRARWRADGTLEHMGRLDFQVKVRGFRIELGEIEAALLAAPQVAQAVALAREDRPGDVRIVAYVVPQGGGAPETEAMIEQVRRLLPDYMVPQHVVLLDALPLLPNGKLDRKALPAPDLSQPGGALVAPRNKVERIIATAMAQVLGAPEVGTHDDFFSLGGHSLLAAQLTARINRELGVSLGLRALFDGPTVAQLAVLVDDGEGAAPRAPIPRRKDRRLAPMSLMQERLWLLDQLQPGQLTYNTPSAHRLRGPLDPQLFEQALRALAQRQDVLRSALREIDGEPVQVIDDVLADHLLPLEDLTQLPEARREARVTERIGELIHVPFDLAQMPLWRARLFKLDAEDHVLFFMAHHAIWDGWSFDVLYADIAELYGALVDKRQAQLPPLPIAYGDFAAWQRDWMQGPEYARQLTYWRDTLGRDNGRLQALPTDYARRPGMAGAGQAFPVEITRDATDAMHAAALMLDSTLFVTLLSAFFALIARVTGQREIIIATPVRGREREELEGLLGYFTNLLPLRMTVDPEGSFSELVRQVKSTLLDAMGHPDIRLEDLMRELKVRGRDGGVVLYHALFSFQDIRQRQLSWGGASHQRVKIPRPAATEDMGLWFVESEAGLSGALNFNADLFRTGSIERLWQRYRDMLSSLARDPLQTVAALTAFDDGHPDLIGEAGGAPEAKTATPSRPVASGAAADSPSTDAGTATHDELERQLAAIWCEVLGCEEVAADDDFFAMGGHSLQAVQLFHRFNRQTGVNLPLATLFSAPTLRALADAYRQARADREGAVGCDDAQANRWAPLVEMRAQGGRSPLFLVHAVGGNVLNYRQLADRLPLELPVYGLQARGLDGRSQPRTCIKDMAGAYVREIRRVQPHGPYHLAGGSMGGMIAYEMAQQLVATGEEVAFLGLIDTSAVYGLHQRGGGVPASKWARLRRRLRGKGTLGVASELARMLQARMSRLRTRIAAAWRHRRGQTLPHALRYAELELVHHRAYQRYVVEPYPGHVTVFRAAQQRGDEVLDEALGWRTLASAVETLAIPGDHDVIVEAPELAACIGKALDRVQGLAAGDDAQPATDDKRMRSTHGAA